MFKYKLVEVLISIILGRLLWYKTISVTTVKDPRIAQATGGKLI